MILTFLSGISTDSVSSPLLMNSVCPLMYVSCPIDFQGGVNDFDVGVNESIFFSFVCRMTQMNAQKCY